MSQRVLWRFAPAWDIRLDEFIDTISASLKLKHRRGWQDLGTRKLSGAHNHMIVDGLFAAPELRLGDKGFNAASASSATTGD
jgi:hypothetical protein